MKAYLTVKQSQSAEIVIKRSRFVAAIANVEDACAATAFVNRIKSLYGDATHNCYAYIINETEMKCSDDGEPQGTAGAPILEVLRKSELQRTAIVVTRYFGGVKLGSAGLIGAYSASAAKIAGLAEKVKMMYSDFLVMDCDYSTKEKLDSIIINNGGCVLNTEYLQSVTTEFVLPKEHTSNFDKDIADLTSGRGQAKMINSGYFAYNTKRGEI